MLCPIGFVCDHIEVLYDLDHEAANVASSLGIALTRAEAVNNHPRFLDALADVVLATVRRHVAWHSPHHRPRRGGEHAGLNAAAGRAKLLR